MNEIIHQEALLYGFTERTWVLSVICSSHVYRPDSWYRWTSNIGGWKRRPLDANVCTNVAMQS